jgi:chemotaxis-related protein WspD
MNTGCCCWREIGSTGDRSCPKLVQHQLCINCDVFAAAAQSLLDRPAPADYRDEWTRWVAAEPVAEDGEYLSLCPFRLGPEWFALPTGMLSETLESLTPRRIPHRSSPEFLGLITVRGEPVLCFSLRSILSVGPSAPAIEAAKSSRPVTLVCGEGRDRFAFPVDETAGLWRVAMAELQPPPATVSRSDHTLTTSLIELSVGTVALLDATRLVRRIEHILQ